MGSSESARAAFRGRVAAILAVAAACAGPAALLFVQVRHPFPFLNDSVLHFGLIQALASAPERGQSLLDPWVPTWCSGFPVFHYYQSLPHFLVLGLWKLLGGALPLVQVFRLVEWLLLATFPVPVYLAMRRLGADRSAAAAAAVLAPLIKTNYLHGHDMESYVWQGLGQYTQVVGGWLFPLAVAWTASALRDGRAWTSAAVLLTATFLSHLALGTMAAMAGAVTALLVPRNLPSRLLRLAAIGVVTGLATAWVLLPIVRDFAWYNISTLVPTWKYNSFGANTILPWLFRGEIFDFQRTVTAGGRTIGPLPVLTLLVGAGFVLAAVRIRRPLEGTLLALFTFFLLLFFGRPTWGDLLRYVPLGSGFHYSRAIFPVHVLGVMLAGVFAGWAVRRLAAVPRAGPGLAAGIAALVLAAPAIERTTYLRWNAQLVRESAAGYAAEGADLERALAVAAEDRFGRAYAGSGRPGQPWGGTFLVGWVPVYAWFPMREMDALGYLYHMWSLNSDLQNDFRENAAGHYRALGVRRILAPEGLPVPPFAREIAREGRFRVLAVDGPGLVELVDAPWRVDVAKANLSRVHRAWLRSPLPAASVHPRVHLSEEGPAPSDPGLAGNGVDFRFPAFAPPPTPVGEILSLDRRGEDFAVRARVDRPGYLLLRMSFHPGWEAVVDGEVAAPTPLVPSFVGVALDPGEHEVSLRYRPDPTRAPLLLFGATVLAGAVFLGRRIRL